MRHNPNEPLARQRFVQQFVDLLRSDNATLFIGAGLSRACGLPSWVELMATPIKMLYGNKISPSDIDTLDFYDIADKFEQIHNRASLEDILKHHFSINPEDYKPHVNHRILTRLPIQRIWTTNYDKVIEKALYDEGKKVTVIKSDNDFSNSVTEDVKLYKIHGCIDMPREIVITKSDVFQYYRNYEVMNSNFFSSLAEDTFLFLGFGFADANLKTIIGRLFANYKSTGRPHYAVLKAPDPKNELESHKFDLTINDLAKFNIRTIAVKDYYEITTLLKDIEKQYIRRNIFISGSHHNFMHHKIFDPNNYAYDLSNYLKESTANAESKNKSDQPEYQQEDSQESFDHQQSELYQKARIQKLLMGPEIHKKQPKSNYLLKLTKRTEEYYKEEFSSDEMNRHLKKLLQNIGEQIFLDKDEAFSFYSGYGDGVADMILSGITKKIEQAQIKAFYSFPRIKILPLPHFERRSHDFNNPSYFKSLIQPCGTMVIAKGTMYASDLESGTFEEYHIAKGMSNVLKREQKELYLKILRELNIDLTTSASPKMDVEHWKKIFNLKQPTDEQTEARKNEISKLLCDKIEHQSRIIFYKLDELIGIFKVLVREEWKLTLRTLEESAAKIAVRIDQHLQDNINTKPRGNKHLQIINKNKFIGSEIKLLIFEMTNYFFDDFQPTKVYQFKSKQDSKTFKLTTQIEKVKTVFDQCIKFEEDLMSTKSNSEALPSNCRAILKILEEIRHLLQGHYKYLKIESIGSEFEKLEIQFSAATIQLISHLSKEDALHNEDIAVQLDKRQGIYECYESAFINLVKQTYNEAKPIEKSKKEYKVLEYNLDNLWKRSIQAMIMKDSNMYKMFCSKGELKSDEKILQTIRTFTEQYAHNDFLDSLLNEHAQTIHEHTRKKPNDPNKKSLDNIEMVKRSHISIYRIQLYKYFVTQRPNAYCNSRFFDFVLRAWKKQIGKSIWQHGNHQAKVRKSIVIRMD
jgi:hypothetical protein